MQNVQCDEVIDLLAARVGFRKTLQVLAWFGGANLHIPQRVSEQHTIARICGLDVLRALVDEFATECVWIPALERSIFHVERDAKIGRRALAGEPVSAIAESLGLTPRRIQQILERAFPGGRVTLPDSDA